MTKLSIFYIDLGTLRLWTEEHFICAAYSWVCEEIKPRRDRVHCSDEGNERHELVKAGRSGNCLSLQNNLYMLVLH